MGLFFFLFIAYSSQLECCVTSDEYRFSYTVLFFIFTMTVIDFFLPFVVVIGSGGRGRGRGHGKGGV